MADLVRQDNPVIRYVRETRAELSKVTWPTREQARNLSVVVIGVTLAMSVLLGVIDFLFAQIFQAILSFGGR